MTKRRFHFKLDPVRTLRENHEQAVMKELAAELDQAAALRRELTDAAERLEAARAPAPAGATGAELAVRQAYVERVERQLRDAEHRLTIQDGHVETTRVRLAHAVRERQTLDRLEERRRAAHDLELRRAERVDADEVSLISHLGAGNAA
jgi:flagellar export protein FliJ